MKLHPRSVNTALCKEALAVVCRVLITDRTGQTAGVRYRYTGPVWPVRSVNEILVPRDRRRAPLPLLRLRSPWCLSGRARAFCATGGARPGCCVPRRRPCMQLASVSSHLSLLSVRGNIRRRLPLVGQLGIMAAACSLPLLDDRNQRLGGFVCSVEFWQGSLA